MDDRKNISGIKTEREEDKMNDLSTIMNYEQLKTELNEELSRTANSFVRIGYLLKLARDDRHILDGSGYSDVNEFAQKEYGLDKTQVSRFIRINDRFSIDGNSTKLLPQYEEYGSAKLSLMLTLPDEINEELSPEMTKSDIQAIKEDYEEEQKITDLEVMMEDKDTDQPDEFIALVVKQLNDEHEEPIIFFHGTLELAAKMGIEPNVEDVKEAYIPDGDKTYNIRIAGQGRFMVSMKDAGITVTNMRDPGSKSPLSWEEFLRAVLEDEKTRDFVGSSEPAKPEKKEKARKVEKSKPQKEKVAPVQPKEEVEKVKGEVVEEPAMNPPEEITEETNEPTTFEKQICNELGNIIKEIMDPDKTNWGHITDRLRDTIRLINNATF